MITLNFKPAISASRYGKTHRAVCRYAHKYGRRNSHAVPEGGLPEAVRYGSCHNMPVRWKTPEREYRFRLPGQ